MKIGSVELEATSRTDTGESGKVNRMHMVRKLRG